MSLLLNVFMSRKVIIEMLNSRKDNYKTKPYSNFSINEIDSMLKNTTTKLSDSTDNPLDMTIKLNDNKKCIIKYVMVSKLRLQNIQLYILDMIQNVLKEGDELILITKDKLNHDSSLFDLFESYYKENKVFIQLFWLDTLIINITNHELVPIHRVISDAEKNNLLEKHKLTSLKQMPYILKSDPVAKFYGMKSGDVVELTCISETAGYNISYRYCV